jgi:hypothetical protein
MLSRSYQTDTRRVLFKFVPSYSILIGRLIDTLANYSVYRRYQLTGQPGLG